MRKSCIQLSIALAVAASPAFAQTYPEKSIELIVPYAPGGPADTTARMVADLLRKPLNQPVVAVNRPGAGTKVATLSFLNAQPDGYTLFQCTSTTFFNTIVDKQAGYKVEDLAPIALLNFNPFAFTVPSSVPANSMKEFVALAKANPGKLNYGMVGVASVDDLITRSFLKHSGIDVVAVPYNGFAPVLRALLAGEINLFFDAFANSIPQHRAGKVKILGVASEERFASAPDIPTMKEQGFPIVNGSWLGLCAHAKTPKPIIDRLAKDVSAAIASPDYQNRMKAMEFRPPSGTSPEQFGAYIREFMTTWKTIASDAGY